MEFEFQVLFQEFVFQEFVFQEFVFKEFVFQEFVFKEFVFPRVWLCQVSRIPLFYHGVQFRREISARRKFKRIPWSEKEETH